MQLHKEGALLSDDHSYYGALIKEKVVLYKLLGIRRSVPRLTYYVSHWQLSSFIMMENELVDQLSQKKTLRGYSTPNLNGMLDYTKFEKSSFVFDIFNTYRRFINYNFWNCMSYASISYTCWIFARDDTDIE